MRLAPGSAYRAVLAEKLAEVASTTGFTRFSSKASVTAARRTPLAASSMRESSPGAWAGAAALPTASVERRRCPRFLRVLARPLLPHRSLLVPCWRYERPLSSEGARKRV
jgi:hypothetical protein